MAAEQAEPPDPDQATSHTTLLADGRRISTDELAPLLYDELRRMADLIFRRERPGHTLQPTALVNEAWMKLAQHDGSWEDRAHFLAAAATSMRRVLCDSAKARDRQKRGGEWNRITLSDSPEDGGVQAIEVLDLEAALERMAAFNPTYVKLVELRYYAGLSLDEVAQLLGLGRTKVVKEWGKARTWLAAHLGGFS